MNLKNLAIVQACLAFVVDTSNERIHTLILLNLKNERIKDLEFLVYAPFVGWVGNCCYMGVITYVLITGLKMRFLRSK